MSFSFGYLTNKQRRMWSLRLKGLTQAQISREMSVTRQTINKAFNSIDTKITRTLMEAADINRIDMRRLSPTEGYLYGRSSKFNTDAVITFSATNGIQIWYKGMEHCENCSEVESCRRMLLEEAEERGINLPEVAGSMRPSELADFILSKIVGEWKDG